jgi:hypothetical protein
VVCGLGTLQALLEVSGVAPPMHNSPVDPAAQVSVGSAAQPKVVEPAAAQQKPVLPSVIAVPALQTIVGSESLGTATPLQV